MSQLFTPVLLAVVAFASHSAVTVANTPPGEPAAQTVPLPAAAHRASVDAASASQATVTPWSYSGQQGPQHWSQLMDDYALCDSGLTQSPVDITTVYPYLLNNKESPATRIDPPRLRFVMYPTLLQVTRSNSGLSTRVTSGSYTRINRTRYDLDEVRFHSPAEHLVNGYRYPAELQMVHRHNNAIAIFSVFLEEGAANSTLQDILSASPNLPGETKTFRRRRIDTALLLPGNKGFYLYEGSLTTPPCSEEVSWFVMKKPIHASRQQLLALRGLIGESARPVQQLADRKVLHKPY